MNDRPAHLATAGPAASPAVARPDLDTKPLTRIGPVGDAPQGATLFRLPIHGERNDPPDPQPDPENATDQAGTGDGYAATDPRSKVGRLTTPQLPEHFVTAAELTQQGSAAQRLHVEVARVRELLDQPLPPISPSRRRSLWPLLAVAVILVLLATLAVMAYLMARSGSAEGGTGSPARATATSDTGDVPSGSGATVGTVGGQVAGLPTTGPGIDAVGSALGIQLLADRTISVTEQAVLTAPGLRTIVLSAPEPTLTGDAAALRPTVKGLKVTVDGVATGAARTGPNSWSVTAPGNGGRTIQVRYRLENAVAVSQPSSQGRALALVTPLLAQLLHDQGMPVDLRIPSDGVRNVICPAVSQAQSLCGAQQGATWNVTIPDDATSAAVLLQLDLRS